MPYTLAMPTLSALAELSIRYGSTVVFSTATQPAFEVLDNDVKKLSSNGWKPVEIVPDNLNLFGRSRWTKVIWWKKRLSWDELSEEILNSRNSLAIVNLRRHAKELYKKVYSHMQRSCKNGENAGVFHLSSDMCPAHRLDILNKVKSLLDSNRPCCLISTQCVEAGVDLDFLEVWRAMAPLDAIVQAAGRCNRNGSGRKGIVNVFLPPPEDEGYPSGDYAFATAVLRSMLDSGDIDINDPEITREYYRKYFKASRISEKSTRLTEAIKALDFPEVTKLYRWIPDISASVLVPYLPKLDTFEKLCSDARNGRLSRKWFREAGKISVGVVIGKNSDLLNFLEPVYDKRGVHSGWYILANPQMYSLDTGLDISGTEHEEFFIA